MKVSYFLLPFILLTSCRTLEEARIPEVLCTTRIPSINHNLSEIIPLFPSEGRAYVNEDIRVEGYVVSSDRSGNFYHSISIADQPTQSTFGVQLLLNKSNLYGDFPVGARVRLQLKGTYVAKDGDLFKIGNTHPQYLLGDISYPNLPNHLSGVCKDGNLEIANVSPKVFDNLADAANDGNLNQLIRINNVQFAEADGRNTYVDQIAKADTNRDLIDPKGNALAVRTSLFSNFGTHLLPTESGSITGVLQKFKTTYQLIMNRAEDFSPEHPRFPIQQFGGENLNFNESFTENFDSYPEGILKSPFFINYLEAGTKLWASAGSAKNRYARLSGYQSPGAVRSLMIFPAQFTGLNSLSFETQDDFSSGKVLNVYYTTDFTPGQSIDFSKLIDITSRFTISNENPNSYGSRFIKSGSYRIPATGKGYIIFEYTGNAQRNTTMKIDNIELK